MADRRVDWARIRAEYVRGGVSQRDLAAKHGISYNTLKDRAARESWGSQAQQAHRKVTADLPGILAAVQLSEAEAATRQDLAILGEATTLAGSLLPGVSDPAGLKDWASAYRAIQACRRLALGLAAPVAAERRDEGSGAGITIVPEDSDAWIVEAQRGRA